MKKLLLFILFFSFSGCVNAANDKAFAWRVSSESATVYLFGSIHFADKSFYPLRQEIEKAFADSDSLVVELDVGKIDAEAYNRLLLEKGVYKDGKTIKDVISNETWLQLRKRLVSLNINYDAVKSYRPGILVLTLSANQLVQMGFDPQAGIDVHFLRKAVREAKRVIELETLEQQINLFLNIPDGDLLLKESLYSMDETEVMMADIVRYWKQGDEARMIKLLFEDAVENYPAFSGIYDSLLYERNRQMVSKIENMLTGKMPYSGDYFVVVGSAHLVGQQGIINALKEKGYEVNRF